ncbi:nitrous oxide reductase family maturation protein NosD [Oceanisphaera avium]|uniref:Copper-binding protein n=1 Tax=Oceanisphaera avium TaxID=1903694 RepID=A0A1Y0CZE8_9GAMM|nr:nitrous oxide reductase family maturation protein NosD [Oceanisphaera avium]ART80689.1 copper-binding protein [Oceanisphaera avium]
MKLEKYSLLLLLLLTPYAHSISAPDALKDLHLHAIQAPPDADTSLTSVVELPLELISDNKWRLPKGEYQGNYVIDVPIHLACDDGAIFNGNNHKNTLNIRAPHVTIENCQLTNWGQNLTNMDAGIFVERTGEFSNILNNRLSGPGFGIWVDATPNVTIDKNIIEGDESIRTQDRGNGIHLFAVNFANIINNEVYHVRDGIYIEAANDNIIDGNYLHDMRYGVHYMFSHRNEVTNNLTRRTRTGLTLMQSRQLTVHNNRSEFDQNYGILMNYITYSTINDNFVSNVQAGVGDGIHIKGGEGKGIFIYNSLFNEISHNYFEDNALGVHLTAGSEDNKIYHNSFVNNKTQVKYVSLRKQEWSEEGKGNFWSDYLGWDRNNDGIGDVIYEPNDNVDKLLWLYPQVKFLMNSPSIELLRYVQKVFPVIKYPGVQDSFPLMRPIKNADSYR